MLTTALPYKRDANLIGGQWVQADSGAVDEIRNPATGEVIGRVPHAGGAETQRAIAAAHDAFLSFRETLANDRAVMLRRLHDAIMDNLDSLARLLTLEQGKPLAEARVEIGMSAAYVLWFAEEARRVYGEVIPSPWAGRRLLVTKEPVGVVAAITPWNFPSSMLSRKIGPAIAAGCTAVIKPAQQTPYSGLAWGALCEEVGIPAGVVNIVTGDAAAIGEAMMKSPLVRKITFTGSTGVGKLLMRQAADTVKRVSMELGGNAPFIVFDDADLDRAVQGAIAAKYRNSGQTCVCTNRFYAQAGIYDAFVEKLAAASGALKVGAGTEEGVQIGPLIDEKALKKVEGFVADAREKGARVVTGGKPHPLGGTFFEPTVIADATPAMRFSKDEIFGPVAPVYRFEAEDDAIAMANDTEYGLASYFYTRDLARAFRVSGKLKYGMVGINDGILTTEVAPFGGVKESGVGREGSRHGIEEYLDMKYVSVGGLG